MTEQPDDGAAASDEISGASHRRQAVDAYNSVWELLDRGDRGADDEEEMTRRAYAAAYHWDRAADRRPENAVRSDWILSRVWVVRGNGELALHHASRCLSACRDNGIGDFDLAYAHEAMARALACLDRPAQARIERDAALAVPIADADDAALVESDLAAGPWYSLA